MAWLATIFTWLGNFFSHKERDDQRQAATDHVTAQVESNELKVAKNAETIRASLDDASDAERLQREQRWLRPD